MWPSLLPFLYAPSSFVAAISAAAAVSLAGLGLSELCGANLAYSKFWNAMAAAGGRGQKRGVAGVLLPSRGGMLVLYAPPALIAVAAFFAVPGVVEDTRMQVLSAALAVHFLKRVLEVLFLHRYSGSMPLATALTVSSCYLLITGSMIYVQHLSHGLPDPTVDLLYPGMLVFVVGITGNFYHHYLLSRLRDGAGDKGYKIPSGGLFDLVICPHYLFEILAFVGFAMISQTLHSLAVAFGIVFYLTGRSCATRKWYASKFEDFPTKIKRLVPYVF
ncbi:hypothetical protein EJB05_15021, partial [Eragrostis curvula]